MATRTMLRRFTFASCLLFASAASHPTAAQTEVTKPSNHFQARRNRSRKRAQKHTPTKGLHKTFGKYRTKGKKKERSSRNKYLVAVCLLATLSAVEYWWSMLDDEFDNFKDNDVYTIRYNRTRDVYTLSFKKCKISYRLRERAYALNLVNKPNTEGVVLEYTKEEYEKAKNKLNKKLSSLAKYLKVLFKQIEETPKNKKQELATMYLYTIQFAEILPPNITKYDLQVVEDSLKANHFDRYDATGSTHCPDGMAQLIEDFSNLFGDPSLGGVKVENMITQFKKELIKTYMIETADEGNKEYETVGIGQAIRNAKPLEELRRNLGLQGIPRNVQREASGDSFYGWTEKMKNQSHAIEKRIREQFTLPNLLAFMNLSFRCDKGRDFNQAQKSVQNSTQTMYKDDPIQKVDHMYAWFADGFDFDEDLEYKEQVEFVKKSKGVISKKTWYDTSFKKDKLWSSFIFLHILSCIGLAEATYTHSGKNNTPDFGDLANKNAIIKQDENIKKRLANLST